MGDFFGARPKDKTLYTEKQYLDFQKASKGQDKGRDVVNYCVLMADACGLDLDEIVQEKVICRISF